MKIGKAAGALYYPYIHIQDPNWLRANLLMFPHIERMVPTDFLPEDNDAVKDFALGYGNLEPLLKPANLWSERVAKAQLLLASKLRRDVQNELFLNKFGSAAALTQGNAGPFGFQIHGNKLHFELRDALLDGCKLGWQPAVSEPYDLHHQYIQVHPRIGQAVMATLAIACAQASGLDIVGDKRSGELHKYLLEQELDKVYDTWLSLNETIEPPPAAASGEVLMEFVLGIANQTSNLNELTPEKIYALSEERKQINKLMEVLRSKAAEIRPVDNWKAKEEAYKDAANDILKNWQSERNNFSGFGKTFFGQDATKLATSFFTSIADKTLTGFATGTITKASMLVSDDPGWIGTLAKGGIVGAGAGLVIGLIVHAGTTVYKQMRRAQESPYRFLSTLERAGVIFRTEAST